MARPTHRLDLLLVPAIATPIEQGHAALSGLVARGVCDEQGAPGPAADSWVEGGFDRILIEDPKAPTFFANRTGGFRVRCPSSRNLIVEAFLAAMRAWRAGGARHMKCPECGVQHALDELLYEPPAAFGSWALVTVDAADSRLQSAVPTELGPSHLVWRRL